MMTSRTWAMAALAGLSAGLASGCDKKEGAAGTPEGASKAEPAAVAASPSAAADAPRAAEGKACCMGLNDCKGKGGCAVKDKHDCAGKNDCKGKGGCNMHCPK